MREEQPLISNSPKEIQFFPSKRRRIRFKDTVLLTSWEKWKKYRVVPWKVIYSFFKLPQS